MQNVKIMASGAQIEVPYHLNLQKELPIKRMLKELINPIRNIKKAGCQLQIYSLIPLINNFYEYSKIINFIKQHMKSPIFIQNKLEE
jgi:hypothetical protein